MYAIRNTNTGLFINESNSWGHAPRLFETQEYAKNVFAGIKGRWNRYSRRDYVPMWITNVEYGEIVKVRVEVEETS